MDEAAPAAAELAGAAELAPEDGDADAPEVRPVAEVPAVVSVAAPGEVTTGAVDEGSVALEPVLEVVPDAPDTEVPDALPTEPADGVAILSAAEAPDDWLTEGLAGEVAGVDAAGSLDVLEEVSLV